MTEAGASIFLFSTLTLGSVREEQGSIVALAACLGGKQQRRQSRESYCMVLGMEQVPICVSNLVNEQTVANHVRQSTLSGDWSS
jgi:hypothetical protein